MTSNHVNRRAVLATCLLLMGCQSKAPSPPREVDESRLQMQEIRLDGKLLDVKSSDPIVAKARQLLPLEGEGVVSEKIALPPSSDAGPLAIGKPHAKGGEGKHFYGVQFYLSVVHEGASDSDPAVDSKIMTTTTTSKTAVFEGDLTAPDRPGNYELRGYAMWVDLDQDVKPAPGPVKSDIHLVFFKKLIVQ